MAGATSIIQLILKKWGDDVAGAAKELEEKVGFPESVANRIATGELPMDAESVAKRVQEQGYGDELYHGSTHDITEFNGKGNPGNDWGQGTYLTDSTHDASRNYAGTHGEDFKARVEMEERQADLDAGGDQYAHDQAVARLKGENDGVIYPVRVKQDGLFNVHDEIELPDYYQRAVDELDYDYHAKNGTLTDEMEDEIYEQMSHLEDMDSIWRYSENPNSNLFTVGNEYNADMSNVYSIEEGDTWQDVRGQLNDVFAEDEAGNYVGSGAFAGEVMSRSGAKGVYDPSAAERFPSMESGEHTIMFPGSENQIRSVNAAYDPEYKGSNIMGNATVPMLGGTAAITAGALAAPALMKDGVFQHGATSEPVVERKEPVRNQSSLLESVTDFGDEVIKSAKHAAGPLSLLVPYEGINDYLKVVNDEDKQPTWLDRLGLLDF
jgi:hypothetical protein